MKKFRGIVALVFTVLALSTSMFAGPAFAQVIPAELVGVWVSEKSVLKGDYLFEGAAISLDTDGNGAFIAGLPPIGSKLVVSYNANNHVGPNYAKAK